MSMQNSLWHYFQQARQAYVEDIQILSLSILKEHCLWLRLSQIDGFVLAELT